MALAINTWHPGMCAQSFFGKVETCTDFGHCIFFASCSDYFFFPFDASLSTSVFLLLELVFLASLKTQEENTCFTIFLGKRKSRKSDPL